LVSHSYFGDDHHQRDLYSKYTKGVVVPRHAKVAIARSKYRAEKVEVGRAAMRRLSYLRIIKFDSFAIFAAIRRASFHLCD
jgi:hypothetical protein